MLILPQTMREEAMDDVMAVTMGMIVDTTDWPT